MLTKNTPAWFKYKQTDFFDKNEEVWNYISNIREFSKLIELYSCTFDHESLNADAIKQALKETIAENFKNYDTNEIKSCLEKSKFFKLNSFNKDKKDFLSYCEKRNRIPEIIEQDLKNLKKLKKSLEEVNKISKEIGCEKYFGCSREIEDIEEAEKVSSDWAKEKEIVGDGSDDQINRLMKLLPKTFDYIIKNKLGWNLGGWSGGY